MSSSIFIPFGIMISGITLGIPTVITFANTHSFTVGEIVSLRVSVQYGTYELNNTQTEVIDITQYTITIPIDSTYFTTFIPNPTNPQQLAMVVPSSSGILPGSMPAQTSLFSAFDNIPE